MLCLMPYGIFFSARKEAKVPGLRFPGPSGSHLTARLRCLATCLAECYRIRAVTQIEDLDSSAKRRSKAAWLEPLSS